jgi:uncharacterized DUF497 family protein
MEFEWDPEKEILNRRKHGVGFDEASTVFDDDLAIAIPDATHSMMEQRFGLFGMAASGRLLLVLFTDRGGAIRLISSRRMTQPEIRRYEERR